MDLGSTVEAFFQDEVERAFRDEGLSPGVRVEHYVVQLLAGYAVQQIESTPYYIEMGGTAYGELARFDAMGDVFGELAGNFVRFVGALALISRRVATPTTDRDILRLYRQWQRTKSVNAAARLAALGVMPPKGDGRLQ